MSKNWTGKLRKAQREYGATVRASVGPYRDEPVEYRPRFEYDRYPWVVSRFADKALTESQVRVCRFSGKDCHPVFPDRSTNGDQ